MSNLDFDIAIIGGGCIGSSILHELSQMGLGQVVLIDKGRTSESATAHSGGMMRVFHESSGHIDLALTHMRLARNLEGQGVLSRSQEPNGSLYFFNKCRFEGYKKNLERMEKAAYPFEVLTSLQGQDYFPEFNWKENEWAIYEPQATHADPIRYCEELLLAATGRGATILDNYEVQRICPYLDRFRISCDRGTITARTMILAGGARFLQKIVELGISLPLSTKPIRTYRGKQKENFVLPNFLDRETLEFGRFGRDKHIILSDKHTDRIRNHSWEESFEESTTLDCYTPDRGGYLGQFPGRRGLILATGWGGTAFKFSLAIGKQVARVVELDSCQRNQIYV